MGSLRGHVLRRPLLTAWLVAMALMMKLLVPAGLMPVVSGGHITIEICSGSGPTKMTMAMPGMEHHQDKPDHQGKEAPCAFAGLSAPSVAATDPILLAIAIALIIAMAFRTIARPAPSRRAWLRPPLRGPPATA